MVKTNEPDADELAQRIQRIKELHGEAHGNKLPKELWDIMWGTAVSEDGLVVPVDPSDIQEVIRMSSETIAQALGLPGPAIGANPLKPMCTPEAHVMAIWYRVRMLGLVDGTNGLLSVYERDGEYTDAVYRVAATVSIKRMDMDVIHEGPPFDTEEFVKQVEGASAGSA